MSNDNQSPNVETNETNVQNNLSTQSGYPNMSNEKTFLVQNGLEVQGDAVVSGSVTATSFIGDGSQLTGISGGTGGGLDSAAVTLLVDSDYVQAREVPQDFAYSSLTGAPTALSSFTNDTNYITAADIPATVDSDYVAARAPAASGGLDSAGVQTLIDADLVGSGLDAVQIGLNSIASGPRSISIGPNAAATNQNNIAIGNSAGDVGSDQSTIAIGQLAKGGNQTGDTGSVAIGQGAGQYIQGPYTVAIGMNAGRGGGNTALRQQSGAVAAGYQSGYSEQGENGIAIGREAGWTAQGDNSIAIGYLTGKSGQGANNISINATGAAVNRLDQFGIDIRTSAAGSLTYDTTNDWTFGATVNAPAFVGDGSGLTGLPSGGGLDSDGVQALIDAEVDATTLVLGAGTTAGIRVGSGATASTLSGGGIAIGQNSNATGAQAIAIGIGAAGDNNAVAIGISAETDNSSISIGRSSVSRSQGVAMGKSSTAVGSATAVGYNAKAGDTVFGTGLYSVALGKDAYSRYNHSMHINSATNLGVGPSAIGGIVIESTLGRLEYSAAADWVFNAGVTMTDLTASGATVVFNNLPTIDPVNAGQLWNDNGTLKISAG